MYISQGTKEETCKKSKVAKCSLQTNYSVRSVPRVHLSLLRNYMWSVFFSIKESHKAAGNGDTESHIRRRLQSRYADECELPYLQQIMAVLHLSGCLKKFSVVKCGSVWHGCGWVRVGRIFTPSALTRPSLVYIAYRCTRRHTWHPTISHWCLSPRFTSSINLDISRELCVLTHTGCMSVQ